MCTKFRNIRKKIRTFQTSINRNTFLMKYSTNLTFLSLFNIYIFLHLNGDTVLIVKVTDFKSFCLRITEIMCKC